MIQLAYRWVKHDVDVLMIICAPKYRLEKTVQVSGQRVVHTNYLREQEAETESDKKFELGNLMWRMALVKAFFLRL